ncbi:E3 ubiquitin-protein ligase COP1-like isoform X1 [Coffea eugenioides]|uniref:E3 ubiquitin-protein ligase COP1-like isoform X1 n=1 Tax=Coffea eugenioides TaxID=49369 RepID=UPI000F610422|nr:E3 ubiquitin-protein ligase COP1-like isoform X1 [Coffea eugenioides]
MGGESSSIGALVPTVKSELGSNNNAAAGEREQEQQQPEAMAVEEELAMPDRDMFCPICMQLIKDAFLTSCGHSFCYMCIVTHLQNKSDCPCCSHFLTPNHLYPNFLLNKLLMKASACQIAKTATPAEQLHKALQQGYEVSVKELDSLLSLLAEKKRTLEQQEAETNMQIMLDFLHCLRNQKLGELNELQTDLQYIKEDINSVERRGIELYRSRDRYLTNVRMLGDDPRAKLSWPSLIEKRGGGVLPCFPGPQSQCHMGSSTSHNWKADEKTPSGSQIIQIKDANSDLDSQQLTQSGLLVARKKRVHAQFNDLQDCYMQRRRSSTRQSQKKDERDRREGYSTGLEDFQTVLSTFTRYSRLRVVAELRHGDLFHSANIVSSIEFDRDDELFATAGVSRRIKVFEFSSVVNEPADVPCPIAEMSTRSKLSCLSWNKYTKNHIASSDYEGIVTVWDVTTHQSVMEYEEHEKRAWSVDFSRTEPSMLVSGSDDCKVKIWCTNQEASVLNIDMKANICSVKYNPGSSIHIVVGSADHHIHYYDLRNTSQPVHIFSGHRKAVSYVKFLSNSELASASTDSTLRLWDVKENIPLRTFRGHTNEKNFVGLTVNSEYIACGSETNEVFVYHKAISKPAAWHKFGSDVQDADEDAGSYFISAVCWKSDSPTMLTANSQGTIKVLLLAE